MQFYSNPSREHVPHALPDCEVFVRVFGDFLNADCGTVESDTLLEDLGVPPESRTCWRDAYLAKLDENDSPQCLIDLAGEFQGAARDLEGWYWHACLPGCLPSGNPSGPFDSEALAIADARENEADMIDSETAVDLLEGGPVANARDGAS